jgi:uncharacterized membrane protein HdeD (DUF308 family)
VAYPDTIGSMIAAIFGAVFVIIGALKLVDYFSNNKEDKYTLAMSVAAIIAGAIIMFCADAIVSVFRILIGIWIIYSGILNLQTTIVWKGSDKKVWYLALVLAILTILAGVYVLVSPGAVMSALGVIIIVYGIIDIIENVVFIKEIDDFLGE